MFLTKNHTTLVEFVAHVKTRVPTEFEKEELFLEFANDVVNYKKALDEAFCTLQRKKFEIFFDNYEKLIKKTISLCLYLDQLHMSYEFSFLVKSNQKKFFSDWCFLQEVQEVLSLPTTEKKPVDGAVIFKMLKKHSRIFGYCHPYVIFSPKLFSLASFVNIFDWSNNNPSVLKERAVLISVLDRYLKNVLIHNGSFPYSSPDTLYAIFRDDVILEKTGKIKTKTVFLLENFQDRTSSWFNAQIRLDETRLFFQK